MVNLLIIKSKLCSVSCKQKTIDVFQMLIKKKMRRKDVLSTFIFDHILKILDIERSKKNANNKIGKSVNSLKFNFYYFFLLTLS